MPVYPVTWLPVVKTGYYPHMAPRDMAIWERFLDAFAGEFAAVAYDVALGGFVADPDLGSADERLGYQYSTALKVDAVLQRPEDVWIVEVKPSGHTSALGAALCYTIVAERDGLSPFPLVPVVVTDRMSPDVKFAADALGIVVVEVPEGSHHSHERRRIASGVSSSRVAAPTGFVPGTPPVAVPPAATPPVPPPGPPPVPVGPPAGGPPGGGGRP